MTSPAFIGAGIGYRRRYRAQLLAQDAQGPAVLEILAEHVYATPDDADRLAAGYPVVLHTVGLSLGTALTQGAATPVLAARVARLAALSRRIRPRFVSDHLAFTVSPAGIDVGHLLPLPMTEEALVVVADRVRALQSAVDAPVLVEPIAWPFVLPGTMSEGDFLSRLVIATGCGVLLDLTNHLHNARNFGFDATAALQSYPLHAVQGIHLAGGFAAPEDGFWIDSHDRDVESASLDLLLALRGHAPLQTIIIERDGHLPDLADLVAQADLAQRAWTTGRCGRMAG